MYNEENNCQNESSFQLWNVESFTRYSDPKKTSLAPVGLVMKEIVTPSNFIWYTNYKSEKQFFLRYSENISETMVCTKQTFPSVSTNNQTLYLLYLI